MPKDVKNQDIGVYAPWASSEAGEDWIALAIHHRSTEENGT